MESKVYFTKEINEEGIKKISKVLFSENNILKDKTAIKVHFGEKGNSRFVSPDKIKLILDNLENKNVFLTDTNTLYRGMRLNATDHIQIAKEHRFDEIGVPIIIADGEIGDDAIDVKIDKPIFDFVSIGKEISNVSSILVISHFKGHVLFGFGGAIKNLGMGCGSRSAKLKMHSKVSPNVSQSDCISCKICINNCAFDAISIDKETKKAYINNNCIGCAKCISVCPVGAIEIPWGANTSLEAQKRCAEHAYGAIKDKNCLYITFVNNITKNCDCAKDSKIIGDDIGIVASTDPLAIDLAAYDLIVKHHKKDIFKEETKVNGAEIFDYSEKIGLGSKKYKIIEI